MLRTSNALREFAGPGAMWGRPTFSAGCRVEIRHGPFRGMRGLVEGVQPSSGFVLVQIRVLGRPVSIEVDASSLERLQQPPWRP